MTHANDAHEDASRVERCLLCCLKENSDLFNEIEHDLAQDFLLPDHAALYLSGVELHEEGLPLDNIEWPMRAKVDPAYIGTLFDSGAMPPLFRQYLAGVRKLARNRRKDKVLEELLDADPIRQLELTSRLQELLTGGDGQDWHQLFHSMADFENAPSLEFAIDGFLQEGGTTYIAGLPGHTKTLLMLSMTRALLDGEPLFGYFKVPRPSKRVLYLVPESTIAPFWARIKLFHLEKYVRDERLLIHTLSAKQRVLLTDSRLMAAAKDSDIFIDTVARFMDGAEDIEDARQLADSLFGLLRAGARTITAAHHSPKGFERAEYMCLENMVRGSGDLGAAICTAWGLRQIDAVKNRVFVQNLKPRDFLPCEPFILEGRPAIDERGCFDMTEPPGFAGALSDHLTRNRGGRPQMQGRHEKQEQVLELKAGGMSEREIATKVGISASMVHRLIHTQALQN
jgi:hypothetical protein